MNKSHPLAMVLYFVAVTVLTMFSGEPILMLISFFFAVNLNILVTGAMKTLKTLLVLLPFALLVTVTNPLVSHFGKTVLWLVLGQAYTLEALLYGANLAVTLVALILHFAVLGKLLNMEKILYLIGRATPNIALLISVTVKNVTSVGTRLAEVNEAQQALGYFSEKKKAGALIKRLKVFSAVISLALEDAVENAVAMRGKCYGVKRRTAARGRKFTSNDILWLFCSIVLFVAVLVCMSNGASEFQFYPTAVFPPLDLWRFMMYISFSALCAVPVLITWKEELKWKCLISKI